MTQSGLLRQLPGWNWTFKSGPQQRVTTKTTSMYCDMINEHNFSTKFIKIWVHRKPAPVYESKRWLGFRSISRWSGGSPNGHFLEKKRSLIQFINYVLEFILSNNSSFEPQHYLEVSYIPIFTLMHTLKLQELQLLKCNLANSFC